MGDISGFEIVLVLLVLLGVAAIPIALVIWAVRRLSGAREREGELLRRIEALEADRRTPRSGAT